MATCILTVVGDDRPGVVSAISAPISAHAASWERSQLSRLAGKFAGIVLVAVADERLDALVAQVLGEFRLAYARMDDTATFHEAFLARNVEIADRVRSGDLAGAVQLLRDYLDDSETALLSRYEPG